MSNLTISQIKVTDNIAERAKTCAVTLAPTARVGAPVGEFQFPGDTQQLSGTNIRPNGSTIKVQAGYGSIPSHTIFNGSVEFMDDLEDPDQYIYNIVLSDVPADQSHRNKTTRIFDPVTYADPVPAEKTSSWAILEAVCAQVGIPFGRCDLPNFAVVGTFEVLRENILQVAEKLCAPFNLFEFQHYFVRVDSVNGLSIIKVDYTEGGKVTNTHSLLNIENKTRSFARYMPENRIGSPGDILLTGGDMIGWNPTDSKVITSLGGTIAHHTYTSSSDTTSDISLSSPSTGARTESETYMDFIIEAVNYPGGVVSLADGIDIDEAILELANGSIANLIIHESTISHSITRNYDENGELAKVVETFYTYERGQFSAHVYTISERSSKVLISDVTITTEYPGSVAMDASMVKRNYNYNDSGVQDQTTTKTYVNDRGAWVLDNIEIQQGTSVEVTNATIQYFVAMHASKGTNDLNFNTVGKTKLPGIAAPVTLSIIGKYQLLNGAIFTPMTAMNIRKTWFSGTEDPSERLFEQDQREKMAYTVGVPFMDYEGLQLIYALILRQISLEAINPYWEDVKVTCSLDTSPAAGESVIASGSSGICNSVEHLITEDSAVTSLSLRRLVI
jgi:hypothetical protein